MRGRNGRIPGAYLAGRAGITTWRLSLMAVWFLIGETHRGQQATPASTLPQVRYGPSVLLLEAFCTPGVDYIGRHVQRQSTRNGRPRILPSLRSQAHAINVLVK